MEFSARLHGVSFKTGEEIVYPNTESLPFLPTSDMKINFEANRVTMSVGSVEVIKYTTTKITLRIFVYDEAYVD